MLFDFVPPPEMIYLLVPPETFEETTAQLFICVILLALPAIPPTYTSPPTVFVFAITEPLL